MKPQYINRTLQPPDKPMKDTEEQIQDLLDYVKKNYKPTDLFDLYEHDKQLISKVFKWLREIEDISFIHRTDELMAERVLESI